MILRNIKLIDIMAKNSQKVEELKPVETLQRSQSVTVLQTTIESRDQFQVIPSHSNQPKLPMFRSSSEICMKAAFQRQCGIVAQQKTKQRKQFLSISLQMYLMTITNEYVGFCVESRFSLEKQSNNIEDLNNNIIDDTRVICQPTIPERNQDNEIDDEKFKKIGKINSCDEQNGHSETNYSKGKYSLKRNPVFLFVYELQIIVLH